MSFSGLHFLLYKFIWSSFLEALLKKNTMQRSLGYKNFSVSELFLHHPPTIAFMLRREFFWGGAVFAVCFLCLSWIENTTVLAAVYGPKSVTGKKENPEYASLEVIWKPKSGLSGNVLCSYFAFSQMSSLSYLQFFLQLFLRYPDVILSASDVVWRENNSILAFCSNPCNLTGKFEKEAELIVKRSLESIILAALYPNLGISIILQVVITLACSISGDNM